MSLKSLRLRRMSRFFKIMKDLEVKLTFQLDAICCWSLFYFFMTWHLFSCWVLPLYRHQLCILFSMLQLFFCFQISDLFCILFRLINVFKLKNIFSEFNLSNYFLLNPINFDWHFLTGNANLFLYFVVFKNVEIPKTFWNSNWNWKGRSFISK